VYDLKTGLAENAAAVEKTLNELLPAGDAPESRVFDAMRYAIMVGGKRLRPFLVMASANLFDVQKVCALRAAAAIEMVHSYSLVHDDLPAMDDDDLRRGQPSTHRKFDEATAILAGDALLTMAFEILGERETHSDPNVRCKLVTSLAKASGAEGMVGGQMIDLQAENQQLDANGITRLQQLKTGRLIAWSCEAGAILGKADHDCQLALAAYAHDIGLAFQIADDILDIEGDQEALGKTVGKDLEQGKATFVSLLGMDQAKAQANMLSDQAVQHLQRFDERAEPLRAVARFVVERKN
tara:strand:+ start:1953 stop:2840 length:888 start_codon:yes stop_codon:yes gene_type:complete